MSHPEQQEIESLRARIAALEAERDGLRERLADIEGRFGYNLAEVGNTIEDAIGDQYDTVAAQVVTIKKLRERLAAAVEALLKYGQHLYDCDGRRHSNYACDCGFKAAIAKAEGREVTP